MFDRVRRNLCLVCALVCAAVPLHAAAEVHALIMTISEYAVPGAAPLKGVLQDGNNAREIARHMGVRDANMIFLKDQQLTLEGMRTAFNQLEQRLGTDDQVFIYYSGHGGRQLVTGPEERCAESLITVDGHGFIDAELESRLKTLSRKAEKLIVFLDACHSGGVTTRSAGRADLPFAPKYLSKGGADSCAAPVNVLKRSLGSAAKSVGSGAQNYVYIAAARDNEVSLDQPGKGGVATQAWLQCLSGEARDLDGSGAISAEEIRVCAQERINTKLQNVQGFLPHHISITGNSNAVLAFAKSPAPVATAVAAPPAVSVPSASVLPVALQPSPPPPAQLVAVAPAPPPPAQPVAAAPPPPPPSQPVAAAPPPPPPAQPVASASPPRPTQPAASPPPAQSAAPTPSPSNLARPPAPTQTAAIVVSPVNTLKDIFARRDDRRRVTLTTPRESFKIGRDLVQFSLTSSHAGYVYVLMVGTDGSQFDMLYPNLLDKENQIAAGQTLSLPRPNWQITAGGPPGKDHLLVIVADSPRDFSKLNFSTAGPFSIVDASMASAKDIQFVSTSSANASRSECGDEVLRRNLNIAKSCSNAFGAALLSIEEVN